MPTTLISSFDYLDREFRLFHLLPHGPESDHLCGVRVHLVFNSASWTEATRIEKTSCIVFGGFCEMRSSGNQLHGIRLRQMVEFDLTFIQHCTVS